MLVLFTVDHSANIVRSMSSSVHTCVQCTCVHAWLCEEHYHTQPMLTPALLRLSEIPLYSFFWANQVILRKLLMDCPISRQLAFLMLITEEILCPSSSLSHFFLWVLFPRLPPLLSWNIMFNLNRIRCIGTSHEYILCTSHMNLEWILGTPGGGEEWI